MELPTELIGMIASYVAAVDSVNPGDEILSRRSKTNRYGRKRLASLRLVNTTFCRSATPLLFQHVDATADNLGKLSRISGDPYAGYVRHLTIGDLENNMQAKYFAKILPHCLARLRNLRSLDFFGPFHAGLLSTTLLSVDLPKLRELHISFPSHAFEQLLHAAEPSSSSSSSSSSPSSPVVPAVARLFGRLRHLSLDVQEWTSGGNGAYAAFPNTTRCFANMLGLAALAENLESLDIGSADTADMDGLRVPPSWRLRSLCLRYVSISADKLVGLVRDSRDSLESVLLWEVDLKSGTWAQVLADVRQLVLLPPPGLRRLFRFHMDACGYAPPTGGSSLGRQRRRPLRPGRFLPPWGFPQPILVVIRDGEHDNAGDFKALRRLQPLVQANRAAAGLCRLDQFTNYWKSQWKDRGRSYHDE